MGRAGLRDFGGDDITAAIFLYLKVLLAKAILANDTLGLDTQRRDQISTTDPIKILTDENLLGVIDRIVPTDFEARSSDVATARRKELTLAMWKWSENVKRRLSEGRDLQGLLADKENIVRIIKSYYEHMHTATITQTDATIGKKVGVVSPNLKQSDRGVRRDISDIEREVRSVVEGISLTLEQIDKVVRPAIDQSVDVCKKLLAAKLGHRAGLLDDVFLIGNGSRYPLIGKLVRESLLGMSDSTKCHGISSPMDENDAKNAVAKGAALALARKGAASGVRLEFDVELSERLPYSISWFNAQNNSYQVLFKEEQLYRDIKGMTIAIPQQQDNCPTEWVKLYRQWPGNDPEPFLLFYFPGGVQDEVEISFDQKKKQFVARCLKTGKEAEVRRDINSDVYVAPPQRGKIRLSPRMSSTNR
jgi:hypothetical protein